MKVPPSVVGECSFPFPIVGEGRDGADLGWGKLSSINVFRLTLHVP